MQEVRSLDRNEGSVRTCSYQTAGSDGKGEMGKEPCLEAELHDIRFHEDYEMEGNDEPDGIDSDETIMKDILCSEKECSEESMENRTSFLAQVEVIGDPMQDIREDDDYGPSAGSEELQSNETQVLEKVYKDVGGEQVTKKMVEYAPP